MTKVFWRCNSGHYYSTLRCPEDGWTFQDCAQIVAALESLAQEGKTPSISELSLAGVSRDALRRTIIVEFGNEASVVDAIIPEGYVIRGEYKTLSQLDLEHR